jgi:hypothetical protein
MIHFSKGNMAEYLLPAVLVGLVAVGGLSWAIQGSFTQQGAISLFQGNQVLSSTGGKSVIETRQFGQNPYLQTLTLTTEKGTRLVLPNVPVSVLENIEVNGGHGTVEQFSALLKSLADQLLASGEIDATNAQAIKALANQGHHMGNLLGEMDALAASCGESKACLEQKFFHTQASNGVDYPQIHGSLFHVLNTPESSDPNYLQVNRLKIPTAEQRQALESMGIIPDNHFLGETILDFADRYSQINLNQLSPQAQSILNFSAFQVAKIPMFTSSAIRSLGLSDSRSETAGPQGQINVNNYKISDRYQLTRRFVESALGLQEWPSELVHQHSGVICTTGQGSDTGRTCQ